MKSETVEEEITEVKYPCLMVNHSGMVCLFTKPTVGLILKVGETTDRYYNVGVTYTTWPMSAFQPFKGKLILSND